MTLYPRGRRRPAFTLLEIILALALASVILYGLYLALQMYMKNMQMGRDVLDEARVSRGVFQNLDADVNGHLAPMDGRFVNSAALSGTADANGNIPPLFNLGVQGNNDTLTIFVTALPRESLDSLKANADTSTLTLQSDLRYISYWLTPGGLARYEARVVTPADGSMPTAGNYLPPAVDNPDIIAAAVTSVKFQYWDGSTSTWADDWDGTVVGSDGTTPKGPPSAIAVTLTVTRPGANGGDMTFRHLIAIPPANITSTTSTSTGPNP
jgi:prepilin-type N-terminal cleavage/methylation domain-containing protein